MIPYAFWVPWFQSLDQVMHNYKWPVLLFICNCTNFKNPGNEYLRLAFQWRILNAIYFLGSVSNEYISTALIKPAFPRSAYRMNSSKAKDQELSLVNKNQQFTAGVASLIFKFYREIIYNHISESNCVETRSLILLSFVAILKEI